MLAVELYIHRIISHVASRTIFTELNPLLAVRYIFKELGSGDSWGLF